VLRFSKLQFGGRNKMDNTNYWWMFNPMQQNQSSLGFLSGNPFKSFNELNMTKQDYLKNSSKLNTVGTYANLGLDALNTGLGFLNYNKNKNILKKQGRLLDQQYSQNKDLYSRYTSANNALSNAFK
jgi:hypothetical protein